MPEGDVLHRAAARLQVLVGERLEAESPNPRGRATGVATAVDGRVLESVRAVGKHLLLSFEGGLLVRSHLRMSGRWRVSRRGSALEGSPWLVLRGSQWQAALWNGPELSFGAGRARGLGPDLLAQSTAPADVALRLRRSDRDRLVGEALVDQRVVSGIGNMWLAEMLWHARVSPWRKLRDASDDDLLDMLEWVRAAMLASVRGVRPRKAAHRRAGRACLRCGTPILSRGLGDANRIAYWCPTCQPG